MGVFGTPLLVLVQKQSRAIPPFLEKCFKFLLVKTNLTQDVFRIPGNEREIERLVHIIEASGDVAFNSNTSPHTVAAILMKFLSELPEHVLEDKNASKWSTSLANKGDKEPYTLIRHQVKKLPKANLVFLSRIMAFFKLFAKHEAITGLSLNDIAEILAPNLIADPNDPNYVISTDIVVQMMKNYKKIFHEIYSISKKKFISSNDFEKQFFNEIYSEFFTQTIKVVSNNQETFTTKKMCRNVELTPPNWERLLGNLLSRERRAHAQTNAPNFTLK
ncbi:RhoGAP domain containing protein [Trichomonas vaginalis G3]|uniref:RhoGAP domain containing protein n=1 Tax=Trichomonas vaginalis (strain ATCC PRA-98 / G3) TaxID=412133 RepID=A2DQS3_TRIV3|nr:GTPase activator protein [Trichomonas vaginalis G3]EAY17190.1 RhoGAP domain containing protein [Trichomonas vaginalis G3]KAI5486278.1 GTPase activator protein [Trichomonas vaginalis G3]|eukprot:XP_001329413.1 RhoGAP domain containing protein [Trichomonas vaginalis G3]